MSAPEHVLVAPVVEGGEFVFAHLPLGGGIRVWTRGLVRYLDESPRRLRGVAAPLYGGSIRNMGALRDFLTGYLDSTTDMSTVPLQRARIRDTRPLVARTSLEDVSSRMHFSYRAISPMQTIGAWEGAAPEMLLSRVRGMENSSVGYFATGLPELPADSTIDALPTEQPGAVIGRVWVEGLAEYLHAPVGHVLHHLAENFQG